ncbi:MAG: DNA modification methylase [Candidatus Binataceae bacterium]
MSMQSLERPAIVIDAEFRSLVPPLSDEERGGLEVSIRVEGCRDALVVWRTADGDILLDGHNRWEICDAHGLPYRVEPMEFESRADAKIWIVCNQFARRNLATYQKVELALTLKPLLAATAKANQGARTDICPNLDKSSTDTTREIAKTAGISRASAAKAIAIAERASEDVKVKLRENQTSLDREYKTLRKVEKERDRAARAFSALATLPHASDQYETYCGDFRNAEIADASLDWIITDPPYERAFLPNMEPFAEWAAAKLKPGGSAIVMMGVLWLPVVMDALGAHLTWNGIVAYLLPGPTVLLHAFRQMQCWKPLLWYVKGRYKGRRVPNLVRSDGVEKGDHAWQQSESGMLDIVRRFTEPGQLVCDPFMGSGTTGVAALKLGRRFVGSDIDGNNVSIARSRLDEVAAQTIANQPSEITSRSFSALPDTGNL